MKTLLKEVFLPSLIMAAPIALGFYFLNIDDIRPLLTAGYVLVSLFSVFCIVYGFGVSDRQAKKQGIQLQGKIKYLHFHVSRFAVLSLVPLISVLTYSALFVGSAINLVQVGALVVVSLGVIYGALLINGIRDIWKAR